MPTTWQPSGKMANTLRAHPYMLSLTALRSSSESSCGMTPLNNGLSSLLRRHGPALKTRQYAQFGSTLLENIIRCLYQTKPKSRPSYTNHGRPEPLECPKLVQSKPPEVAMIRVLQPTLTTLRAMLLYTPALTATIAEELSSHACVVK